MAARHTVWLFFVLLLSADVRVEAARLSADGRVAGTPGGNTDVGAGGAGVAQRHQQSWLELKLLQTGVDPFPFVSAVAGFQDLDMLMSGNELAVGASTNVAIKSAAAAASDAVDKAAIKVFLSGPGSLSRIASDWALATYLKHFGTPAQRAGYAVAVAARWALEHKAVVGGVVATAVVAGGLLTFWYKRGKGPRASAADEEDNLKAVIRKVEREDPQQLYNKFHGAHLSTVMLLAAQAELLAAGASGLCDIVSGSGPLTKDALTKLLEVPQIKAQEEWAKLAPVSATCWRGGTRETALDLPWSNPEALTQELQDIDVLPDAQDLLQVKDEGTPV